MNLIVNENVELYSQMLTVCNNFINSLNHVV